MANLQRNVFLFTFREIVPGVHKFLQALLHICRDRSVRLSFLGVLALLLLLHAGTSLVQSQMRWSPWHTGSNVVLPSLVALPPCWGQCLRPWLLGPGSRFQICFCGRNPLFTDVERSPCLSLLSKSLQWFCSFSVGLGAWFQPHKGRLPSARSTAPSILLLLLFIHSQPVWEDMHAPTLGSQRNSSLRMEPCPDCR